MAPSGPNHERDERGHKRPRMDRMKSPQLPHLLVTGLGLGLGLSLLAGGVGGCGPDNRAAEARRGSTRVPISDEPSDGSGGPSPARRLAGGAHDRRARGNPRDLADAADAADPRDPRNSREPQDGDSSLAAVERQVEDQVRALETTRGRRAAAAPSPLPTPAS